MSWPPRAGQAEVSDETPSRIVSSPAAQAAPNLADHAAVSAFSWQGRRCRPGRTAGWQPQHGPRRSSATSQKSRGNRLRCAGSARADSGTVQLCQAVHALPPLRQCAAGLGVSAGRARLLLLGRLPELTSRCWADLWRAAWSPLFSAFGPSRSRPAARWATRACWSDARTRRKIRGLRSRLPGLRHVIWPVQRTPNCCPDPACKAGAAWSMRLRATMRSARPTLGTWRCCISPAAPRASPIARSMCMARCWRIWSRPLRAGSARR